ncbi:MAG: hypothetical protein AAGJ29_08790 [Pseudomonadota bacterium]
MSGPLRQNRGCPRVWAFAGLALALALPAVAQSTDRAALTACLEEIEDARRLACYDEIVLGFGAQDPVAEAEPTDGQSAANASPAATPAAASVAATEAATQPEAPPRRVTLPVASFRFDGAGKLVVTLENGQVWRQIDQTNVRRSTRDAADEAEIRRGRLGSVWMKIDGGRAFKVKRQN